MTGHATRSRFKRGSPCPAPIVRASAAGTSTRESYSPGPWPIWHRMGSKPVDAASFREPGDGWWLGSGWIAGFIPNARSDRAGILAPGGRREQDSRREWVCRYELRRVPATSPLQPGDGALHLLQGLIKLFLGTRVIGTIAEVTPEITRSYSTYSPQERASVVESTRLFELAFGAPVATFSFPFAAAHFLASLPRHINAIHNADLGRRINGFRRFECALSSAVTIVLIAALFGIYGIASRVLFFLLNISMTPVGLVMEQWNSGGREGEVNWSPAPRGCIAGIDPWIAIRLCILVRANSVGSRGSRG